MKHCDDFVVVENRASGSAFFKLSLRACSPLPEITAGQFVEVGVRQTEGIILRRPISIHDVDYAANTIVLLIRIAGKGTRQLSMLEKGERVNLIYPLGRGFECRGEDVLLAGGGVGVAPLLFLAKSFHSRGVRPHILLGYRDREQFLDLPEFDKYGDVFVATQDGSLGERGMVTEHSVFAKQFDCVYACGPTPMMRAVAESCRQRGIECFVSLENKMACGIGACLCCVQQTTSGHRCTCTDGPVFNSEEVIW